MGFVDGGVDVSNVMLVMLRTLQSVSLQRYKQLYSTLITKQQYAHI